MLPNNTLATVPVTGEMIWGKGQTTNLLIDYELGGVGLNDPSQGLMYQIWTGEVLNLRSIYFSAPNTERTLVYSSSYQITELSITFDQNMHPYAAFMERGFAKMYWFNSSSGQNEVFSLPAGARNPKITLDDKRSSQESSSDVILAYMQGTTLYVRYQRDRFLIAYPLQAGIDGDLLKIGFTDKYRMQFELGKKMSYNELLKVLSKGSPIEDFELATSDPVTTPSIADIWELERKD